MLRDGGMSFHGGFLGMVVAIIWVARRHRVPMLALGDCVALAAPIGIFLGRLANFINGELFGRITDVPWAIVFPKGGHLPRHPSQIYEALLEGVVLFVVLALIWQRGGRRFQGLITGTFISGYGVSRIIVEFAREPDQQLGFLIAGTTMGQWLSLPMVMIGALLIRHALRSSRRRHHRTDMTTPLETRIRAMIEKDGPMPVDKFMALCLTDPEDGYYRRADPLGAAGDFTTAPEISQMFGELVGLWLYDEAIKQGVAAEAALVELGPGRGTLMKDALRCYAGIAPEHCWDLHLVEVNPALIAAQQEQLAGCTNARPHWHEQITDLPEKPLLIIANEFFDALPIRQFKSNSGNWYECMFDLADDALTPVTMATPAETDLPLISRWPDR